MVKIHITGANGYIGALMANYLEVAGNEVEKAKYRLPDVPPKSIDADYLIHLAVSGGGTIHTPRKGLHDPALSRKVNIEGMKALLKGLKNKKTKVILMSSTSVYGKFDHNPVVSEESPLTPVSVYGQNKIDTEKILINSEFDWMIFRPCGIFGHSAGNRFGNSFLNVVVKNAINKHEMKIMGGDQEIDTLYINDLMEIILRVCSGEWHSKEIYNIAGEFIKVKDMLHVLYLELQNAGITCKKEIVDFKGKPAVLADTKKIRRSFPGWSNTPLTCSFHNFVNAHINQHSS